MLLGLALASGAGSGIVGASCSWGDRKSRGGVERDDQALGYSERLVSLIKWEQRVTRVEVSVGGGK